MHMSKPYSAACDNNRDPIYAHISRIFSGGKSVLEIGSGTGQHAVYFAGKMPHLSWQCSDLEENISGIRLWLDEAGLSNTPEPLCLDVMNKDWVTRRYDAVFSANAIHIMGWSAVQAMLSRIADVLKAQGLLVLYGPFNYNNEYTSESNAKFDMWLKERNPQRGIRNFEDVNTLLSQAGFKLVEDNAMPANNRLICWQLNRENSERGE